MSVPSLFSMCLSEVVRTNRWHEFEDTARDDFFSAIANQNDPELFFAAAQQLDLSQQSTKEIYLKKIKSILESFQNNQNFSIGQFRPVASSIMERTWNKRSFREIKELEQEAKSLSSRKFLEEISRVCKMCEFGLAAGAFIFVSFFSSLYYFDKIITEKDRWEKSQLKVRPLFKNDSDAIKICSVLLAVLLALHGISKFTKNRIDRLSNHLIKNGLTEKLINMAVATLNPNRQVDVAKDRALIAFMRRNIG